MLRFRAATVTTQDLAAFERDYAALLGYRVRERGTISRELAASWGAKRMSTRKYLLLSSDASPDVLIRAVFQVGLSSPVFYVGLVLLTVFAAWLRLFPVGGYGDTLVEHLHHLFLPAVTLAFSFAAVVMRSLRASILQVLTAEYVDFARAKGLRARVILLRHVLRNAMIATVTLVGLHVGSLLGGAVITESVFAVPGVGRLMVESIFARDYPVIQALTLVLAVLVSLAFLITDILQMWLDPRLGR